MLLLLILALLAMFGMIAVAFVVISGQAQRSAKSIERIDMASDPPQKTLHQAAMQVLRGPTNAASVMRAHSLLEDIYGNDPLTDGQIASSGFACGKQLLKFTTTTFTPAQLACRGGCVLTITAIADSTVASLVGKSTRIVYVDTSNTVTTFYVMAFSETIADATALVGAKFIINGVPFSGTGFGFDTTNGSVRATTPVTVAGTPTDYPLALLPNDNTTAGNQNPPGGANEDYDAADFQNVLLAAQWPSGTTIKTIPSLHRPQLISYWMNEIADAKLDVRVTGAAIVSGTFTLPAAANLTLPSGASYKSGGTEETLTAAQAVTLAVGATVTPNGGAITFSDTEIVVSSGTTIQFQGNGSFKANSDAILGCRVPDGTTFSDGVTASNNKAQVPKDVTVTPPANGTVTILARWLDLWGKSVELGRKIMLRPIGSAWAFDASSTPAPDHPNFTGSNPYFDPTDSATWDVDNDGDGVPDSIWVDLGMPVRSTADGRLYKPLFAILCVDMDGRLNLNAHGSLGLTSDQTVNYDSIVSNAGGTFAGAPDAATLSLMPRGLGFGPAEINLNGLFTAYAYPTYNFQSQLLKGITGLQGRYGATCVPGASGADPINANKWFEYGQSQWDFSAVNNARSYGSPIDPFGVGVVGLDQAGRPLFCGFNYDNDNTKYLGYGASVVNNPYEANLASTAKGLSGATAANNLFSVAELERLLRPFDRDATTLPSRLALLTATNAGYPATSSLIAQRRSVTTESWDLPCPNVAMPASMTGNLTNHRAWHITDLLRARGIDQALWADLLPADVLAGLKMNLNRPFGNGIDDDAAGDTGYDVVDQSQPAETEELTLYKTGSDTATPTVSYDGTGTITTPLAARQREARYLYVLACLTVDLDYLKSQFNDNTANVARYLAQWAVNVVDFKDRDSIMTRFDYDLTFAVAGSTPTTWNPAIDGSNTVWGCERPELLITETLAFHDRRTEDTADETEADATASQTTDSDEGKPGKQNNATGEPHDGSFDQTYRPQGSLFVELYNPSSRLEPRSGDLFQYDSADSNWKLVLTKKSPDLASTKGSPVWRMLIASKFNDPTDTLAPKEPLDPDNPDSTKRPTIEREVYFVTLDTSVSYPDKADTGANVQYYPSTSAADVVVGPGGYAVVGSGETSPGYQTNNPKRTYIGFIDGGSAGSDTTRYVDLSTRTVADPYIVHNNDDDLTRPATTAIDAPSTLAIDAPFRLSISEPVSSGTNGYDTMRGNSVTENSNGKFVDTSGTPVVFDIPFDLRRSNEDVWYKESEEDFEKGKDFFVRDGTTPRFRTIYLQRLADPLKPYNNNPTSDNYNPYRTVDMSAVDLTVFNGTADNSNDDQITTKDTTHDFQDRQRGDNNDATTAYNIWKQDPLDRTLATITPKALANTHYYNWCLTHSFGYLNTGFLSPQTAPYIGDPAQPFPWLTWNNRPFASALELLLVPTCSTSKLLTNAMDGTAPDDKNAANADYNKYFNILKSGDTIDPYGNDSQVLAGATVPYPHLMNFFQSKKSTETGSNGTSQFHRILEYVGVPSPFTGTDTQANPDTATSPFLPPFNSISAYREPGRINLNTIYPDSATETNRPAVWKGLMSGFPTIDTNVFWSKFLSSRKGNLAIPPTEFGCPFRSFGGWTMTPSILRPDREIDVTLLRHAPDDATRALFQSPDVAPTTRPCNDTYRSPLFRYQSLMRLGNLTTTRSNVYAVWITVGYFEVTPLTAGSYDVNVYPDGYVLGQELGIDTGDVERHRAFYMFDRTLPVGFQRGQDLNTEKAILIQRFIE